MKHSLYSEKKVNLGDKPFSDMPKKKKKQVRKKKIKYDDGIEGYDFSKDPVIKKKGDESVKFLTKVGFPKEFYDDK